MTGGWPDSRPELAIGAIAVLALCGAAFAFAGAAAAVITLSGAAVLALAVLRALAPPDDLPPTYEEALDARRTSFTGFWRRRAGVEAATQTMTGYDFELRDTLQHLLAARLAERHGISLREDPAAARRLLAARGTDRLWFWLDPSRPTVTDQGSSAGIPPRTLAAIIDRLERL